MHFLTNSRQNEDDGEVGLGGHHSLSPVAG